jgi:hypothetical protein
MMSSTDVYVTNVHYKLSRCEMHFQFGMSILLSLFFLFGITTQILASNWISHDDVDKIGHDFFFHDFVGKGMCKLEGSS